jgi:hypothetical protein
MAAAGLKMDISGSNLKTYYYRASRSRARPERIPYVIRENRRAGSGILGLLAARAFGLITDDAGRAPPLASGGETRPALQ